MKVGLICFSIFINLFHTFAQDQKVIYRPVFINQCTQEIEFVSWYLHDNIKIYNLDAEQFDQQKIIIPDTGSYSLMTHFNLSTPLLTLDFDSFGIFKDTFYTKKLDHVIYISNPPFSEHTDCDSLAEGLVFDYYYNGNLRLEGNFQKGQPVDSMKEYYRSGVLKERYVSQPKTQKRRTYYYQNGQIESDYHYSKGKTKKYYPDGQLKSVYNHSKNRKFESYYVNGQIKVKEHKTKQLKFNTLGQLVERKTRRAGGYFSSFGNSFLRPSQYHFQWSFIDSIGNTLLKIKYINSYFYYEFLDSIQQIQNYPFFSQIYLYKNGKVHHKIDFESIKKDEEYKRILVLYKKEDQHWIEISQQPIEQLSQTIDRLQQGVQ